MTDAVIFASMTPDEQTREIARLDYEAYTAERADRLKYEVKFVEMVFKALFLANGGAMIALFSLVGAIGHQGISSLSFAPHRLWWAFCAFSVALAATLITGVCVYFTQMFFARATAYQQWIAQSEMLGAAPKEEWRVALPKFAAVGDRFINAAIVLVAISLIGFIAGCAWALASVLPAT